ncbi:MAG: 5'-nucleotidase C-terminal domain-containing protein [Oscillospiraceae bacterium]|nr:5'-nucleotidase C-terminal domain-containing protein [Oscillospiraceae bacterium]
MSNIKKLTLLHSNDMHGDFVAENIGDDLVGGVSMLSGYVQKVRNDEENVLYTISGDMFRGSVIDSEYRGVSTIEIMNMIAPDVATLGNHEADYGISHLLFLEKCARFPIINANLYLTTNQVRLFKSHIIMEVGGMKVMFIGILTEEVLAQARQERLIGSFVDVHEAAAEVGKICNAHRTDDIDLTVLLTHIGFEEDKKLAALLDPKWGVDIIVGGHSHTLLEEPCVVAGIPIVQAATGTDQIGRFDININTDTNSIDSYTWQLIPIDDDHCPRDEALETVLKRYHEETDKKYGRYITRFSDVYTHPARNVETQLGRLFADVFRDSLGIDVMFLGSGSLRNTQMGPIVDFRELTQMFPYNDEIYGITVTGAQLKHMIAYLFRPEALAGEHTEFYQFSRGIHFVVNRNDGTLSEITFEGAPIDDERLFKVGLQSFHYKNMGDFFDMPEAEVEKNAPVKVLSTSAMDIVDEHLSRRELVLCPVDERWVTVK